MISLPRGRLLFDTSAYIRYARESAFPWLSENQEVIRRSVLTVVVAAELYAGAKGADDQGRLDSLCQWHRALGTLSFPNADSWLQAGRLLERYARLYGTVRMVDHFRDILIALEAVKHGATLVTENARDFLRWRKLLRPSGRNLAVFNLQKLAKR